MPCNSLASSSAGPEIVADGYLFKTGVTAHARGLWLLHSMSDFCESMLTKTLAIIGPQEVMIASNFSLRLSKPLCSGRCRAADH